MCGRFTLHSRDRIALKGVRPLDLPFEPRYNIAPSQNILAIGDFRRGPEARVLLWGLVPSWSTDGKGFINARAETIEDKPSFSESFRSRRCLIPADGFFEWRRSRKLKQPYYFYTDAQIAFAGIWDTWKSGEGPVMSCAIITTPANEIVGELHDRMPAILSSESFDVWLDPRTGADELKKLLVPFPASKMTSHPVSSDVNHPDNDFSELLTYVNSEIGNNLSLF